jgi:hypothetical protein
LRASRSRAPLIGLLLLAFLGGACSRASEAGTESVGTISRVQGSVDLVRDGETTAASADDNLFEGDEMRVEGPGGSVSFDLGGRGTYELVAGSALIRPSGVLRLNGATLLVSSDEAMDADLETLTLSFDRGTVRVELPSGRVAAYEVQNLKVARGTQDVPLPQLWQISVLQDGGLDQVRPLQFSREDAVDAVQLAHALDADGKLGNLLRGLEPQLAATNGAVLNQRLNAAGVSPESLGRFSTASRSDQLMALAFAREWKKDLPAEVVQGFEQALALKVLGATWGLVAQNFGVNADGLVASLQSELTAVLFPNGATQIDPLVPRPPAPTAPRAPVSRSPRGTSPAPAPPPAPAPGGTAAPSPTPPGLVGPVLDPLRPLLPEELEAIVDELYGLVQGLIPIV